MNYHFHPTLLLAQLNKINTKSFTNFPSSLKVFEINFVRLITLSFLLEIQDLKRAEAYMKRALNIAEIIYEKNPLIITEAIMDLISIALFLLSGFSLLLYIYNEYAL